MMRSAQTIHPSPTRRPHIVLSQGSKNINYSNPKTTNLSSVLMPTNKILRCYCCTYNRRVRDEQTTSPRFSGVSSPLSSLAPPPCRRPAAAAPAAAISLLSGEMNERETRDFMSVDAFSQLPFIRPAPPARDKNSGSAIRLFGIEFANEPEAKEERESEDNPNSGCNSSGGAANGGGGGGDGAGRKFECHYCCRNFPTSQALGGHQNAHKRERQHARRAHLQPAMAGHPHHQALGGVADRNVYGLVSYHHLGSMAPAARFGVGHAFETPPPSYYPSWVGTNPGVGLMGARFYGGPGSVSQPINGSPLPGLWRIPAVQGGSGLPLMQCDRTAALPFFGGNEYSRPVGGVVGVGGGGRGGEVNGPSLSSPSLTGRLVHGSAAGVQDQLSLDLHL